MADLEIDINKEVDAHMLDPLQYEPDFKYRFAEIAQTDALRRLVYTDTDSSFTDTLYLITYIVYSKYKIHPRDLLQKIKVFNDDAFSDVALGREDLIKLIQRIAYNLEALINQNILNKFAKHHGIEDEFNKLEFKQEYIFSAIYLNGDKNYLYRAIAEKGVIDDIFDSLNIGQKSDKSEATNKVIKFLGKTMLIEGVQQSLVYCRHYIEKFRKMIIERDKSIAIPASLSKSMDEYKKVTQSSRAALIYEIITGNPGRFTPGSKGKLYFVSRFNWDLIPNAEMKIQQLEKELFQRWGIVNVRSKLDVILIHEEDEEAFNYDWFVMQEEQQLIRVLLKPLVQLYAPIGVDIAPIAGVSANKLK